MSDFRVIVPCTPRKIGRKVINAVTYPARGYRLYTREEAIEVLKKIPGAWAESKTERFDLTTI